jgi:hypothetical protein
MLAMASAHVAMACSARCPECMRNERMDTPPASVMRCRTPENDDNTSSASAHRLCTYRHTENEKRTQQSAT